MAIKTIFKLGFMLAALCQALPAVYAETAGTPGVLLAPGLEIVLPDSLKLELGDEANPLKQPMVIGEVAGKPGYFIAAVKIKSWEKNSVLWRRLETEIRKQSSDQSFNLIQTGHFVTHSNDPVHFRIYEYQTATQTQRQVYFLLNSQRLSYWITLTMTDEVDTSIAIPLTKALIRRARIHGAD
ncbi:hypothetical protein [Cellvibrio fontiphilus]|uniref:DUF1795 domain-containing protein n=1 Tax=Cellvibrio fontiphilus TaxID=1815559 RepID=A0ABV7FCU2_9GAMM